MAELLIFTEHTTGTAPIAGVSSEAISFTEHATGIVSILGRSAESLHFSESSSGYIVVQGRSSEQMPAFSEKSVAALWGRDRGSISFGEHVAGTCLIAGRSSESLSFGEHIYGSIIEPVAGVWCINLATSGHSRYEGALDGSARVDAYAVLPPNQLGSDRAKYVRDIYVHMRTDGDVEITTLTDEQIERGGYIISDDGRPGLHRRRRQLAGGIKGTNWGFKLANVDGSNFTIKSAEPVPVGTKRVQ